MPHPQYELHPLCTLFPRLSGAEFDSLRDDIAANGLSQPIVLLDGQILDGGNRYRACLEAGVEPHFSEFKGGNIVSFVLSANLHRRHMSAGQQAAIVATAQDWAKAQSHGGDRKSDQPATLPLDRVADRAAQSGASERTQRMADKVAKADPALAKQVAHGEVSLPKAVAKVEGKEPQPPAPAKRVQGSAQAPQEPESRIAALEAELAAVRDNAAELAEMLESYDTVSEGEASIAKEMARLKAQIRTVEATRNQWMTTCGELRKEVTSLQRKLAKLEGAK
ncbi:hypothetical protein [Xanthomonas rydalmerensis]|uniref:ParB/Sulfiredoxin domain-containing protein n=1 Tax=Xanthomonas rydalmerensis TaxID=3046274 RepID=A0ABZ0JLN6_9XANT|nr:hypothetical protein [Xanthomonas sp. DM-2023]WOS40697.1 hypothetical protein QN243_20265 [Xanthomonas sp. DM-2023]WOS44881.1 hypothetical protein QN242_20265 [Xanthomonas sp. DM-2023]WOS49061.1 hypothetical protein QN240_20265 [Xanthomonas sp. DM-2023]WOS53241.1 hypothetical protein QN244_20270 [Xanthomonas sp. DM-2023]WOS57424.1 hypothetical protein QN245_20265 [Xanthomonas sp. DM-2023]